MSTEPEVQIRSFRAEDLDGCRKLYVDGLLGGKLAENDSALDIDDIDRAYMHQPGNHFWVACTDGGELIGMIGVQHYDSAVGEIRRLRVREEYRRRGIGTRLVETALKWCQDHNYLKVTLDTFMEREPAVKLFEKFNFKHSKSRNVNGKDLLYFYLDIYGGEQRR